MDTRYVAIACAGILGGCATGPTVSGDSSASPRLKSDAAQMVSLYAKAASKCERVESIQTHVLRVDPAVKANASGAATEGNIDERWTVRLCGAEMPFLVTFIPDGKGGTFFRVRPDKGQ